MISQFVGWYNVSFFLDFFRFSKKGTIKANIAYWKYLSFFFSFFFLISVIKHSTEKDESLTVFVLHNGFEMIGVWSRLACSSAHDEILFTKLKV